jgi:hypothetical protein
MVPAATVLGGVNGQNSSPPMALLNPDQGIGDQPIVRMYDVEHTPEVLRSRNLLHERPAHVLDLVHKIGARLERTAMIVDTVNPFVGLLTLSHSREDMHFMALPLQCGAQLRDVGTHASHWNGME